jgi:outer membrane murein-binding lipoprotein Lpp
LLNEFCDIENELHSQVKDKQAQIDALTLDLEAFQQQVNSAGDPGKDELHRETIASQHE